jgi:hypothetical protein
MNNLNIFCEGEFLLAEEEPFVALAVKQLVKLMGVVDHRWQPVASRADCPYVYFVDLQKGQHVQFYNDRIRSQAD